MLAVRGRLQAAARRRLAIGDGAHVELGGDVEFERSSTVRCRYGGSIRLGDRVHISHGAYLSSHGGRLELGNDVYVGPFAVLYGAGGLTVGDDTRIAQHVSIVPGNHIFSDVDTPIRLQGHTREGVIVGRDVWIAANVTVLDGVTIGDGAVVAAGAVVNRDVEPYSVVGGVPARPIAQRGGSRDPQGASTA